VTSRARAQDLQNAPVDGTHGLADVQLLAFLAAGPKESRAWTIRTGATAPEAAGVIHTDFQRGFITAEVGHQDLA